MMIKRLLLLCLVGCAFQLEAQQIHFTQFDLAPMTVNPALTGSFSGTIRAGGIFRDQYFGNRDQTSSGEGFINLGIGVEYNALRGLGEFDWIALGINFSQFNAGGTSIEGNDGNTARFKYGIQSLNLAYHLGMGKKGSSVMSFGVQYGNHSRNLADQNGLTPRSFLASGMNGGAVMVNPDGTSFGDFAGGITYTAKNTKTDNLFRLGFAVNNILGGDQSILTGGSTDERGLGYIGFIQLENAMNKKSTFKPALLYQKDGYFSKMEAQVKFGYLFNEKKDITLNYGLGYRFGESAQLLLGVDYGQLKAGLAYDMVLGGVRDAARETIELGVAYIFNIEKKPERVPVIFCPRL